MRFLRLIAFASLAFIGAAQAQDIQQTNGPAPFWVLRGQQGGAAGLDYDFQNGRYYQSGLASGIGPSQLLTVSRASSGTNLLPTSASGYAYATFGSNIARITPTLGLLVEEARTNQLLNSTAPATLTTGSLANATYTLWVNGTGTATMSSGTATGCGTGVASQGVSVSFTTSGAAGTCTVTVAGSLNAFQLEAGTFGTSLIVTAGVTAVRAADIVTATTALAFGGAYTLFGKGTPNAPVVYALMQNLFSLNDGTTSNFAMLRRLSTTGNFRPMIVAGGAAQYAPNGAVWAQGVSGKSAMGVATSIQASAFNGVSPTPGSTTTLPVFSIISLGYTAAGSFWNGYIERVALWPTARLSSAVLQSITK